jgi:hypothetical protein
LVRAVYRLEVVGADRLPVTGPAVVVPNHDSWLDGIVLARIIHERFCCNRGFAAATSLDAVGPASRQAGSPLSRSISCSRMPPSLAAPRACLAWRLRDFATNRHE